MERIKALSNEQVEKPEKKLFDEVNVVRKQNL